MGAISSTTEPDVDLIIETNLRLSSSLWGWCAGTGTRFIYASSGATYGDGSEGFDDDPSPEAMAGLRPLNAYGWSKHLFDRRVIRAVREERVVPPQWAGLKFFNVYGPNEYHKGGMQSVVSQKFAAAAAGEPVTLFRSHRDDVEDGGQLRDFIFVDDCVQVVLWLLDNPDVSGIFNVGTGTARSFRELAEALIAAVGSASPIEYIDTPEAIRPNYQYYTCARMERLREAGYDRPFTSLENGVTAYVQNYLMQPCRYR
jgi:ADP-L-glycero-D-manno-heptose 6-epimerase